MKTALLSLILFISIITVRAQEVSQTSWPKTAVLPEAHDWSIGFDVVPIIKTVGNLFHTPSGNDSVYSEHQFHLVGLYVKNSSTAYRAILRIGFGSTKYNNLVQDDANISAKLTDTWTDSYSNFTVGFGIQKWKGQGRLRGIYGGEALIMLGSHSNTFTYGNAFTSTNQTPTTTDFSQRDSLGGFSTGTATVRPLDASDPFLFGFGLNGFLGVEYFFAPKMSLSAEYGWGFVYSSVGEATANGETWTGGSGGNVTAVNAKIAKAAAYQIDVHDATSIILHFYF